MKILFYSPHPNLSIHAPAGYATHMKGIIHGFKSMGYEVKPLIMGDYFPQALASENNVRFKKSYIHKIKKIVPSLLWETIKDIKLYLFDKKNEKKLEKIILEFKPDLVYERMNYLQTSGIKMALKHNIKHITEVNAPYIKERIELQGKSLLLCLAKHKQKYLFNNTHFILPVSGVLGEYIYKKDVSLQKKTHTVSNGIHLQDIHFDYDSPQKIRLKYHIPTSNYVIGFAGSIQKWHGIDIMLKAFKLFSDHISHSTLLIIGSGESMEEYKLLSKNLGIEDKVVFTGNVSSAEVYNYLNSCDLLLLANSNWYCSPIKIFEYAAIKKPMVLVNSSPVQEIFTHLKHAYLCSATPTSMFEGIMKMYSDRAFSTQLVNNAYHELSEKHTWANKVKQIADLL